MIKRLVQLALVVTLLPAAACAAPAAEPSLVPAAPSTAPDYFCTWNVQGFACGYAGPSPQADMMVEAGLFGQGPNQDWLGFYPDVRADLKQELFVLGGSKSLDFHPGTHFTDTILHATPQYGSAALQKGRAWLNGRLIDARATDFPQTLSIITLQATANVRADQLAKDRQFPDRCWQGEIAEILLYNVALSDADREAVENYLIRKYAVKPASTALGAEAPARQAKEDKK